MAGKLRFGLVGAGSIAQSYAQAFKQSEQAELVAVADVRLEAARAMAEGFNCRSFGSYEEMFRETKLDAVLVCTPPVSHPEICLFFLEKKIHVLCEKPLSISSSDARRMLEAAHSQGVLLSMGSKFRYVDDVVRAKSLVASGILGEIVRLENVFTSRVDMAPRWNSDPVRSGGGVLIDNGTHSVDIMRYLAGPVTAVQVTEVKRVQDIPVEDSVHVCARTASGVIGTFDLSWSLQSGVSSYINLCGTRGTVALGWQESRYKVASGRDWEVFGKGYDKIQGLRSQLENFARAARGEERLLICAEDAVASVEVIEACYESLRSGGDWVAVGSPVSAEGAPAGLKVVQGKGA